METWLYQTIIIHLFFLGSIFVIYFRSPVINGLRPQADMLNPPAKRLVLIVLDGLRADSFFNEECRYIPNITKMFREKGLIGVSHTRVPTESRPGHIALIAGLYEDPSAVTRGWKENPIDFDSVFNRSKKTFAWGSHDILSIFSKCTEKDKMNIFSYNEVLDFSGKDQTFLLDTWVFERVKSFIQENSIVLKEESRVVYFLHLLGLDSAGHIHKPGSSFFHENLLTTDRGVFEIYQLFEEAFSDNGTAYVLTSDHGMTNTGSHGSGHFYETKTPFFIWGAGINNWNFLKLDSSAANNERRCGVPIFELEQASFAPLMSSLIGVAVPMNNYGILPIQFLNVSRNYLAKAFLNNALQILSQYESVLVDFKTGLFSDFLPEFESLRLQDMVGTRTYVVKKFDDLDFSQVINICKRIIQHSLEGIEYYQTYYKNPLLFCTTMSFFGWMLYLWLLLQNSEKKTRFKNYRVYYLVAVISVAVITFLYCQRISFSIGIYLVFPVYCWIPALKRNILNNFSFSKKSIKYSVLLLIGSELLVSSFYRPEVISVAFGLSSLIQGKSFLKKSFTTQHYQWIVSLILLITFPFYPSTSDTKSDLLLFLGVFLWVLKAIFNKLFQDKLCILFSAAAVMNLIWCLYFNNNLLGAPSVLLFTSWILGGFSFVGPLFSEKNHKKRIQFVLHYLEVTYMLLSISYEFLCIELLSFHLLALEDLKMHSETKHDFFNGQFSNQKGDILKNFTTAFNVLLFTLFSFFGTGNIASVSSFDPNIARCFLTAFSPFTMMCLVILKLVIPIILIISVMCEYVHSKVHRRNMFLSLLLICEVMGLNFLFMVTNKGSWLEIGSSISHFVIMEVTTLFLLIIYCISKWLINTSFLRSKAKSHL